jgi:transposase
MDRQTLRDWVHRFNAEGPDGLIDRQAPGPTRQLTPDQREQLAAVIRAGPDPDADRVVRWRRVDLQQVIFERFGVWYHKRHVSRVLHELGFSHMTARPQHVGQDPETIETFKKLSGDRRRDHRQAARRGDAGDLVPGRDAGGAEEPAGAPVGRHRHASPSAR